MRQSQLRKGIRNKPYLWTILGFLAILIAPIAWILYALYEARKDFIPALKECWLLATMQIERDLDNNGKIKE